MEQRRMNEIIHGVLVNSTELAYIEEAYGTLALLENTNEVFRYFAGNMKSVTLFNELEILGRYLAIQKVRYGDRFHVNFSNDSSYKSVFIGHMSVIGFFDAILVEQFEKGEEFVEFTLYFETAGDKIRIKLMANTGKEQYYHKEFDCI